MRATTITCDVCGMDLTEAEQPRHRIHMWCEAIPYTTRAMVPLGLARPQFKAQDFCSITCLKEKVATL